MLDLGMDQKFLRIYDLIKGDDFIIFFFSISFTPKQIFVWNFFFLFLFWKVNILSVNININLILFEFKRRDTVNWSGTILLSLRICSIFAKHLFDQRNDKQWIDFKEPMKQSNDFLYKDNILLHKLRGKRLSYLDYSESWSFRAYRPNPPMLSLWARSRVALSEFLMWTTKVVNHRQWVHICILTKSSLKCWISIGEFQDFGQLRWEVNGLFSMVV